MDGLKYNYVFCVGDYDYNRLLLSHINPNDGMLYNDGVGGPHSFVRLVHRIHTSPKANRILFDFPGKSRWHHYYFKNPFTDNKPICFVFYASYALTRYDFNGYLKYLKSNYPSAKYVFFYEDMIESFSSVVTPEAIVKDFDIVFSYDKAQAQHYGICYHPTVASRIDVKNDRRLSRSDVYLLAAAKDRYLKYRDIYDYFCTKGINCDFNILGVSSKDRDRDGIHYLNRPMPYMQNLQHVLKTKCILDIQQQNAVGFTIRLWEAILYDRKLLTDNSVLSESVFYDPRYVSLIRDGVPDLDFIRSDESFINPYKKDISPRHFAGYLDELL